MKARKSVITFLVLAVIVTGFVYFKNNYYSKNEFLDSFRSMNLNMPNLGETKKKLSIKDVIVTEINSKRELIFMEAKVKENIIWDESFGDWEIFRKLQNTTFYGIGQYGLDLKDFSQDNVTVDYDKKIISIEIPQPKIVSLEIDGDKTSIDKVEKGLLRFGGVKLSPEQQKEIYSRAKDAMLTQLKGSELLETAKEESISAMGSFVDKTLGAFGEGFNINVYFTGDL